MALLKLTAGRPALAAPLVVLDTGPAPSAATTQQLAYHLRAVASACGPCELHLAIEPPPAAAEETTWLPMLQTAQHAAAAHHCPLRICRPPQPWRLILVENGMSLCDGRCPARARATEGLHAPQTPADDRPLGP